jgi:ubiquinone/menaquinone biosynthesis C-methylase UbiE
MQIHLMLAGVLVAIIAFVVAASSPKIKARFFAWFWSQLSEGIGEKIFPYKAPLLQRYIKAGDTVADIGAGVGGSVQAVLSSQSYPSKLLLLEPNVAMHKTLRSAAEKAIYELQPRKGGQKPSFEILTDRCESMSSLHDGSIDVALMSLLLCSVKDQEKSLQEAYRVLKPGGKLIFLEHVRVAHPFASLGKAVKYFAQRILTSTRIWPSIGDGCCLDRDTLGVIKRQAGFRVLEEGSFSMGGFSSLLTEGVLGVCEKVPVGTNGNRR